MMQWEAKVEARFAADIKQTLAGMQSKIDRMSEGVTLVVPVCAFTFFRSHAKCSLVLVC